MCSREDRSHEYSLDVLRSILGTPRRLGNSQDPPASEVSLNGAIAQYWAIQRWSHTKLRRVSPAPSRVPPMCPLSARSPPRSIAPSGGPKHAVWAEIRPAACRRRRRNWPLCGLSGRRGGLHSQITGGEEWEKISKKSTLTYRRNSKRVIWFN